MILEKEREQHKQEYDKAVADAKKDGLKLMEITATSPIDPDESYYAVFRYPTSQQVDAFVKLAEKKDSVALLVFLQGCRIFPDNITFKAVMDDYIGFRSVISMQIIDASGYGSESDIKKL